MSESDERGRDRDNDAAEPAKTPRKRSRWPRRIGIALLLLILLLALVVGFLPKIASTKAVSDYALSIANKQLRGEIECESLSASWGGPIELRGVRVLDPDNREVLKVPKITYAGGVWRAASSALDFGEIRIESPRVNLHIASDGALSIAEAFQPRTPSTGGSTPGGSLPEPRGRLIISDGALHVSKDHGTSFDVSELDGDFQLKSLADIGLKLDVVLADGGKLSAKAAIRDLFSNNEFNIDAARGTVAVQTDGDIDVGPLAEFVSPGSGVTGATNLKIDATLADGDVEATFATSVSGLHAKESVAAPIDLSLDGRFAMTPDKITARADLSGQAGGASADIVYERSEQPPAVTLDDVLSAILTGQAIDLPGFSVEARANVDLAALEQAVPGLLRIEEGRAITGGKLSVKDLSVHGGDQPSASGVIELTELSATSDGRAVNLAPVSLDFDTRVETGKGLDIRRAELNSGVARVVASGAASNLRAEFSGNLTKLKQELGQVFDLGSFDAAGDLTGVVSLTRAGDDRVDVTADITASQLRYAVDDRRLDLPRASVNVAGAIALANGKATRLTADKVGADLNGQVIANASGWYDLQQSSFQANADIQRADLGFIASRTSAFGLDALNRYAGALTLKCAVACGGSDQPITSAGNLVARNLTVDGQSLAGSDDALSWTGVQLAADGSNIGVDEAKLQSGPASLTATGVRWQTGEKLVLDGKIQGSADLKRALRAVGLITQMEEPPAVAGRLSLDTTFNTSGDVVTLAGRGRIDQLEVGEGQQAVREQRVAFEYDALIDDRTERITVNRGRVVSTPLTADISGAIDKYKTTQVLSLAGRYEASWKELTALLHELAPATAETIMVAGKSSSKFTITGPLNQPGAKPSIQTVTSGLDVGWRSAEVYGVPMGLAKLSPELRDGRLILRQTAIPAARGQVNLGAVIDFRGDEPTLTIPRKLRVLDDIAVTTELSKSLLSRINPIFLHLTRVEGTVRLDLQDVVLPFGQSLKTRGSGRGRLDLVEMKVQPGGLLAELLALGGLAEPRMYAVTVGGLDFLLKDGRFIYKDFTLTFADGGYDLKFYGSVGLDDTLDLVVSLPIREDLLRKLGVRGPVVEYARQLAGSRVDLPLVGTRLRPKLDFSRVDVKALVESAVKKTAGEKADALLRGLLAPKDKQDDQKDKKQKPKRRRGRRKKRKP